MPVSAFAGVGMSAGESMGQHPGGFYEDTSLLEEAKQVQMEFGVRADNVAALRADKLFRDGDVVAGSRWLKIFRIIAMSNRLTDSVIKPAASSPDKD